MTQTVFSAVIALATLFYNAMQALLTILLTHTQTWRQKRHKLLSYRWFWRGTAVVVLATGALILFPARLNTETGESDEDDSFEHNHKKTEIGASGESAEVALVKRTIKESQITEFLKIYRAPAHFDHSLLKRYWLPGSEAFEDVQICLKHLRTERWHYGIGSSLLVFEFRSVNIFGDHAEVGTREHWNLPMVHADGSPVHERNSDQGPYEVDYSLTKVKGRWLVTSTTTPYAHKEP